jgi:hypothetical protein
MVWLQPYCDAISHDGCAACMMFGEYLVIAHLPAVPCSKCRVASPTSAELT